MDGRCSWTKIEVFKGSICKTFQIFIIRNENISNNNELYNSEIVILINNRIWYYYIIYAKCQSRIILYTKIINVKFAIIHNMSLLLNKPLFTGGLNYAWQKMWSNIISTSPKFSSRFETSLSDMPKFFIDQMNKTNRLMRKKRRKKAGERISLRYR